LPGRTGKSYVAYYGEMLAAVNVYDPGTGIADALLQKLETESSGRYQKTTHNGENVYVYELENLEAFAFWSSGDKIIMVGNNYGNKLPSEIISAYLAKYPSDIV